jgi:hypothetical protein
MICFPFYFILFRSHTGVDLFYFHISYLAPRRELGFRFFLLVFSVLIVPSVFDPNLGRVGFSCGDREKLSVSILNKLGFVNDVEGFVWFSGGWKLTGFASIELLLRC